MTQKSVSLKYELASEPLHISVKEVLESAVLVAAGLHLQLSGYATLVLLLSCSDLLLAGQVWGEDYGRSWPLASFFSSRVVLRFVLSCSRFLVPGFLFVDSCSFFFWSGLSSGESLKSWWPWASSSSSYLTQCIYELVLESQLHHKIVNLLFAITY